MAKAGRVTPEETGEKMGFQINKLHSTVIFLALTFSFVFYTGKGWAEEHKVGMEGWEFHPATLTINAGDKVLWINDDDTTHDIAFEDDSSGMPTIEKPERIRAGKQFSFTFNKPGEFRYRCNIHYDYDMIGTIIVKGASK